MGKIKIIRTVTVSLSLGFCREVMIKMRNRGYEMVAVTSPGKELDDLRYKDGFHCIEVPMQRHISIAKDIMSLMRMISVFRKEKPQMVHSMTPKAGLVSMLAAWMTRVPVRIHTFTGLVWPTSHGLKRKILMFTDWLTCACATHIIPEGKGVMSDLSQITHKPMKVLGYGNVRGIDLERFNPERFSSVKKAEDTFTFLFVGRIVGDKGINELVEAFTKLQSEYQQCRLNLVGPYEPNLDSLDDNILKEISNNIRIINIGVKHGDVLIEEYAKADCFVMPSYREGFPNTVLEAGAMGLPQIVTDINGSREIIKHAVNGLIVPPKQSQPLYEAMKRMLTDETMRKNMQTEAREMIASRFEKNFVQENHINYYKEILKHYNLI